MKSWGSGSNSASASVLLKSENLTSAGAVELRMAQVGAAGCHVWPHSMVVKLNNAVVAEVQPPRTGQVRRPDATIMLDLTEKLREWKLEVQGVTRTPQQAYEYVLCVVQL